MTTMCLNHLVIFNMHKKRLDLIDNLNGKGFCKYELQCATFGNIKFKFLSIYELQFTIHGSFLHSFCFELVLYQLRGRNISLNDHLH